MKDINTLHLTYPYHKLIMLNRNKPFLERNNHSAVLIISGKANKSENNE